MTPYENITDRFIRKIKQDKDYFCINGITESEFDEIINQRTLELMDDAINEIQPLISVQQGVDFLDRNEFLEQFNFELTKVEEDLISDLMVVKYYDEEMVKLKTMQFYLGEDIKVFSPANERRSFIEMLKFKRGQFNSKLCAYNTKNRLTGKFLLPY